MSKIYSINTKTGNRLYNRYVTCEGFYLSDVYNSYSPAKEQAYNWCWEKYMNTEGHNSFGICSHNTSFFTVSWNGLYNGKEALFVETPSNSYIIIKE